LQWQYVSANVIRFKQGVVVSEDGLVLKDGLKTQTKRNFPLPNEVQEILEAFKQQSSSMRPPDFIFRSPRSKFIDPHIFANRAWKKILKKGDVPYCKVLPNTIAWLESHRFCCPTASATPPDIKNNNIAVPRNMKYTLDRQSNGFSLLFVPHQISNCYTLSA